MPIIYHQNFISFQNVGNSSVPKYEFTGKLSNGTSAGFMLNTDFELVKFFLNGPIPTSFCLLSSFYCYNFNSTNWKKLWWCAWDLNLQPQDSRRRRNHGAMTAIKYFMVASCQLPNHLGITTLEKGWIWKINCCPASITPERIVKIMLLLIWLMVVPLT